MLSLITHEPNFCILREEVFRGKKNKSTDNNMPQKLKPKDNFEMIYISILREYLEMEFIEIREKIKFEFNIERIIDDFIFFCFFIGNDFLPSLNTLDIDHGSLENIFNYYKEVLPTLEDYITFNGKIDFKKAEKIFHLLATQELNSLRSMIKKIEIQCKERDTVKNLQINEKKNIIKSKKINEKKETKFLEIKKKPEHEILAYKKNKINFRLNNIKKKYEEEMKNDGKENFDFKDDLNKFIKENQKNQYDLDVNNPIEKNSPEACSQETKLKSEINLENKIKDSEINNSNIEKSGDTSKLDSDASKLCILFDSNNEETNQKQNKGKIFKIKKKYYKTNENNCNFDSKYKLILKEAERFKNYINDDNYCSDFNILDINDSDVSEVSLTDLVVDQSEFLIDYEKEYEESQNVDHVFQKKLVEFYVTDIYKAKSFYYKEKVKIDIDTDEGKQKKNQMFRKYFEGLQWVLYYYYRGIQTWKWYYPYHYAPMISDFVNMENYFNSDIDEVFIKDIPYSPLESLVLILPNTSKELIPKCLWSIYEEFSHFFPIHFQIDFNGKKMPWETLVLLPFIDDGEIIKEINNKIKLFSDNNSGENIVNDLFQNLKLSSKESKRNIFGKSFIIQLKKNLNYSQNLKKSIYNKEKVVEEIEFEIYKDKVEHILFFKNNANDKKILNDFPTLKTIPYNFSNINKKVQKYSKELNKKITIRKENKISIEPIISEITEKYIEKYLINGIIFADYPMKREGWIRGIYFNNNYYYLDNKGKVQVDYVYKLPITVREAIMNICNKKSIIIKSNCFCDIYYVKKIERNKDGSIFKIYDNYSLYVPFELTSLNSIPK